MEVPRHERDFHNSYKTFVSRDQWKTMLGLVGLNHRVIENKE